MNRGGLSPALEAMFRDAPVGLGVLDEHGRFVAVNDALASVSGMTPTEHLGRTLADAVPHRVAPSQPDLHKLVLRVIESGDPVRDLEVSAQPRVALDPPRSWLYSLFRLRDDDPVDPGHGAAVLVGCVVIEVTERRQMERERAAAIGRLALTSRASELMAGSLELETTLKSLCELLVPDMADHLFVDLREEGDRLRRVAIRHATGMEVGPHLQRPVGEIVDYAPNHPAMRALKEGVVLLVPDLANAPGFVPSGRDAQLVQVVSATSVIVMPMMVAGRPIGTVAMLCSGSGRRYDEDDLSLAQDVVSRAAVAVANAVSYEQQRSAAVALQRSLLPEALPSVEALDVAWRYLPGTDGTEVGGDWVDVFELPGGRVAMLVGDVMGRGLRAAAVMGQLRTAVRTLAMQDLQPGDLLTRLDAIVAGMRAEQIVTCVYAIYDPGRGTISVANAGHLPPVLLIGDGVTLLDDAHAVPLGVGGVGEVAFEQFDKPFPRGGLLALYTNGLVERPDTDLDENVNELAQAVVTSIGTLEVRCDEVLARASAVDARGYDDDVALLLVRATVDSARTSVIRSFAAAPQSVSASRKMLADALRGWSLGDDDASTTAELLTSEVMTNAVRYARQDVEVLIRRGQESLWVEVCDGDTRQPRLRHAEVDDEGGRGLAMVQALSAAWGTRPTLDGKAVWFRLDL